MKRKNITHITGCLTDKNTSLPRTLCTQKNVSERTFQSTVTVLHTHMHTYQQSDQSGPWQINTDSFDQVCLVSFNRFVSSLVNCHSVTTVRARGFTSSLWKLPRKERLKCCVHSHCRTHVVTLSVTRPRWHFHADVKQNAGGSKFGEKKKTAWVSARQPPASPLMDQ